jgi:hypothetical protein
MVAEAIVDHIRLCNWKIERGPPGLRISQENQSSAAETHASS